MAKGHPVYTARWAERAVEWQRIASLCRNDHVRDMCERFAQTSTSMAEFWGKW